jgi:enoyl-CoA hydratase/carnithine racemase
MTVDFEHLRYEIESGVLTVTLHAPEKLNAFGPAMEAELRTALHAGDADPAVRVIVLTGAGKAFCVGADMAVLDQVGTEIAIPAPPPAGPPGDLEASYERRLTYMLRIGTPLIAAINGAVAGVGVSLSLYCDLRFMAAEARLSTSFSRRGLIAEHGTSWMLSRLVGPMNAMDLLLTGRKITGEEAAALGLVRAVPGAELLETVRAFAEDVAANVSPRSTRVMKRQVYDALMQTLGDACVVAEVEEIASLSCDDFAEGVAHFLERRPAQFTGQ